MNEPMICISCKEIIFSENSRDDEVGFRCVQCDNFTLCAGCEHLASEYHPVMHSFIEMRGYHYKNRLDAFPNATADVTTGVYLAHLTPCSSCQTPLIIGIRYMCTHCEGFNLCSGCHITRPSEHQPPSHAFIKIRSIYGLLNEVDWQQELDKSAYFKTRNERDYIVDKEVKAKTTDRYKSALRMSSNALLSRSNSRVDSNTNPMEIKVDAQSYFAGDKVDDEKESKEDISISYYVEDGDKMANNRHYYEVTYDDKSDDENTNTIDNKHKYDASEATLLNSETRQSKIPEPTPQPQPATTATPPLGLSKAGSVRQLISQFQTLIEATVKTELIKPEAPHSDATKGIERSSNTVPDSGSSSAPPPSNAKINLRGSRPALRKKEIIESYPANNSYEANYDNSTANDSDGAMNSDDEIKITQNSYIIDDQDTNENNSTTYDNTVADNYMDPDNAHVSDDSISEHSSTSSESQETSSESDEYYASDVDDDTFDHYKQHEIFNEIMATEQREWHSEAMAIQQAYESISDPAQQLELLKQYLLLAKDFLRFADLISRIIIDEAFLPLEQKTIKPINVGGVAGGEKYLFRGVFFKFAIDSHNIYGGDYFAAKAASREYIGVQNYFKSGVQGLYAPMMILVDYRGLRLIATPCLPISSKTLKYGSADAGQTVLKSDPILNKKMKQAAALLNLKGHKAGIKEVRKIYGPTDIEGHLGNDGKYYVIDTARVAPPFPPERTVALFVFPSDPPLNLLWSPLATMQVFEVPIREFRKKLYEHFPEAEGNPDIELSEEFFPSGSLFHIKQELHKHPLVNRRATTFVEKLIYGTAVVVATSSIKNAHLYNMLRMESVKSAPVPLSSDAFSNFQVADDDKKTDENNIRELVKNLKEVTIPEFARKLITRDIKVKNGEDLCRELHRYGIPVRCLGLLRMAVKQDVEMDNLVFVEMVSRMAKMFIRTALRRIKAPTINEQICQRQVLSYFNLIFGDSSAASVYWKAIIKPQLYVKYGACLTAHELNSEYDIRKSIHDVFHLLLRLQTKIGALFTKEALQKFQRDSATCFKDPNPLKIVHFRGLTSEARSSHVECLQEMIEQFQRV